MSEKYRLDDLGWFHFERLVQSLLKADIGLAVESWGGRGDFGRDAFSNHALAFPDRSVRRPGPFVFQVKFVNGANAAGARWQRALDKAVAAEIDRIEERKRHIGWMPPEHYVLITNCPLTTDSRSAHEKHLRRALPMTGITQLGSKDVSDLLDRHPMLRRSYPEILSLRDLNELLAEAVSKQVLERSRAAIEESRDLIPVFVATTAYHKARSVLTKHSFVVLDGPPEMGKTAIARTIALGYLTENWQAVDCRGPEDFFSAFSHDRRQLFVADDAFGRTEYDPVLGRMWERDLGRILSYLGPRHRLIWTSRKHILARAMKDIDLTGRAARFPEPGEVIVRADALTTEEKARILYRHAKSSGLSIAKRGVVREHAPAIVEDDHFTPERIRRLVRDVLPALSHDAVLGNSDMRLAIRRAIRDPTERMRKSLRKLPDDHRWVLNCLLGEGIIVSPEALWKEFSVYRPSASELVFRDALDDLIGSFLKMHRAVPWGREGVDWIHPSYRDVVIDQLAASPELQEVFLRHASVRGVALAVSDSGGREGKRAMPLLKSSRTRLVLENRVRELAAAGDARAVGQLIEVLTNASAPKESAEAESIRRMLVAVCTYLAGAWAQETLEFDLELVKKYSRAAALLDENLALPDISQAWDQTSTEMENVLLGETLPDSDVLDYWCEMAELIDSSYPSLAGSEEFVRRRNRIETGLFEVIENNLSSGLAYSDPDTNSRRAQELESLAESLGPLAGDGTRDRIVSRLVGLAEDYRAASHEDDDERYEQFESERPSRPLLLPFDIKALFDDL